MVLEAITAMFENLNQSQLIVLGIIVVFILFRLFKQTTGNKLITKTNNDNNNHSTQWINKGFGYGYGDATPSQKLSDLIQEFGKPSVLDQQAGGSAVWYKKDLGETPFERIEIRDEQIPHDQPIKHVDFLYSWYKVDIPEYLIGSIHKISSSLTYDPLKKLLQARCNDMRPNVVSHWIVQKYANQELTIDEAVGMYGPMTMELFQNDQNGSKYRQLLSEI